MAMPPTARRHASAAPTAAGSGGGGGSGGGYPHSLSLSLLLISTAAVLASAGLVGAFSASPLPPRRPRTSTSKAATSAVAEEESSSPAAAAAAASSSSSSSSTSASPFWSSPAARLRHSTPPSLLRRIRSQPWKGGLEPASDAPSDPRDAPLLCEVVQGEIPDDLRGTLFRNGPGRTRIGGEDGCVYGHWFDGDGYVVRLSFEDDGGGGGSRATFRGRYVRTERFLAEEDNDGRGGFRTRGAWTDARNGSWTANVGRKPTNGANTSCRLAVVSDAAFAAIAPPAGSAAAAAAAAAAGSGTRTALLALSEGGPPLALDPDTLETLGPYDYGAPAEFGPTTGMASAHPVDCAAGTGEAYTCGLRPAAPGALLNPCELRAYKFVPDADSDDGAPRGVDGGAIATKMKLERTARIPMERVAFVHDMALTESHVVFVVPPYEATFADLVGSLLSSPPLGWRFRWNDERPGARVVVLRREDMRVVADCVADAPLSCYHLVNARDLAGVDEAAGGGLVEVQVAAHNGPRRAVEEAFGDMYGSAFTDEERCRLASGTVERTEGEGTCTAHVTDIGPPDASAFELPAIHPVYVGRRHRHVFTNSAYPPGETDFYNSIERLDLETNDMDRAVFGEWRYAMEPVVVPRRRWGRVDIGDEELDAYVLTFVYDSMEHITDLAILNAGDLAGGPIATVRLPAHVPYGFHGTWIDEVR